MILIVAVLAIVLLISLAGWWKCHKEKRDLEAVNYHKSVAEIKTIQKISQLEDALKKAQEHIKELAQTPDPEEEQTQQGQYVRTRRLRPATPVTYQTVFDLDINGQRVLEHLTTKFCREAFVSNERGGERETCHRLGQQSVIHFIINQVNQANDPAYSEEENHDS